MHAVTLAAVTDSNETILTGALLLAIPLALFGGLVSFFSPCVLPLVPGYLSYVTGASGADLKDARRGRMFVGTLLFVLGFTAVFVSTGALFGEFGRTLLEHRELLNKIAGVLMVIMGLLFMGLLPRLSGRQFKLPVKPGVGLAGAPLLGVVFGIGWTPCIGPTLASVQFLAFNEATAGRGALLTIFYCLGLGAPFILAALFFRRALGAFAWFKRHYVWVMRLGGLMMIVTGVLLFTGTWDRLVYDLQVWSSEFDVWI
ncbi:cytochrome c biogenesis CcdA family protein [Streptomyces sp. G-5]|uniref:cytochrome c biogenesis CcdA family protein n=1 Tax=Streptomyces sp. G-5 TaxID=2977231 RepID=UPI0021CEB778|nr:cytochrome c biogenesis protein CcdA [Streptomyces sp. G-5]MCU4750321.1 cytochrome c biogenesis protein CcdA [Streptomyces sp. G-5]